MSDNFNRGNGMVIRRLRLTDEGKKELGHIFGDSVPLQDNGVFSVARIEGLGKVECFFVDWESLTHDEKEASLTHMQWKSGVPVNEIIDEVESNGGFPIRSQYVVFSIDARMVMP